MNALIIYSHPNPNSFNAAIRQLTQEQLKAMGHDVQVRDLYSIGFDPVLSGADLKAIHEGMAPEQIKAEQDHVAWADALIFIHPIWWTGLPAMVKGYIDRIFTFGFAYTYEDGAPKGLLTKKEALIINTTGSPFEHYHENGMHEAIRRTSDEGIYAFCGIKILDHIFFGAVPSATDEQRKEYLTDLTKRLQDLFA